MEVTFTTRRIKIIKSTEDRNLGTFNEEVFKECIDNKEVLASFAEIERAFKANPNYELLHGVQDHLSIHFRDIQSSQEIRFSAAD